ncbi:uncharacterized protein LOC100835568 isoform X2 [Brachypodium distachyon]|uniref:uncharacterized protein LOC100835568 isoform X2 n=1 Tax=Brachypodium distachyon TaxID=15368 RepID=UPI00071CBEAE|nr:uncharacterized protein LOC100835568 isoform X2 [Brachypodium distachyon]|eukprot:XP_014752170.1 uncharacterized protein LOC100835568 isoform X2 [Brachypodium distachyon]
MAQPLSSSSSQDASNSETEHRVVITNKHGEELVGLLNPVGSNEIVVLCHGFTGSKNVSMIVDLADALTKQGIGIFRFDFSGNGESGGEFQYANYRKEADDLHSVVLYLHQEKYDVKAVVGHSKGKVLYRVTKESLMERLNTDMRAASASISKECSFFTVHGSADVDIPLEDAYEFGKHIPTHELRVIEGADHCYTAHRKELSDAVVDIITYNKAEAGDSSLPKR